MWNKVMLSHNFFFEKRIPRFVYSLLSSKKGFRLVLHFNFIVEKCLIKEVNEPETVWVDSSNNLSQEILNN